MAIISWPSNRHQGGAVRCAICECEIPLTQATAGLCSIDGQQQFACTGHSWGRRALITAWSAFVLEQCNSARNTLTPAYANTAKDGADVH